MKKAVRWVTDKFLNQQLDFKVRLFNVLVMAGIIISLISTVVSVINGEDIIAIAANVLSGLVAYILMYCACRGGRYQRYYTISIILVFFIFFPIAFIKGGGYYSALPSFFIFAVVFTVFMLEGKQAIITSALEMILYIGLCGYAYFNPSQVTFLKTEATKVIDIMIGFVVVSIALGLTMFLIFRMYSQQQQELEDARQILLDENAMLDRTNRLKTELFANVSHEMKTPLTVISVHIQRAEKLFEMARDGDDAKIRESFALAQEEIMRMSRLVNSALNLATVQEMNEGKVRLDVSDLLRTATKAFNALLEKNNNRLDLSIPGSLPVVINRADVIIQILSNLLANANNHTQNGVIRVSAAFDGDILTVMVEDNGEGISPAILARVFERGVTDGGGSGYGLAICRDLARSHGGDVTLESILGKGTKVSFTLPLPSDRRAADGEGQCDA